MLDMNRRRIRGISQCAPSIAKKMGLKKGTWLQLSEQVGPGWGDGADEDVPVVDHAQRRRQRAAHGGSARGGGGAAAAAASPRGKKHKNGSKKDKKAKKADKKRAQKNGGANASSSRQPVENKIPPNAHYWLNEHFTFLFRYVPQIGDEVTYVQGLHREYDAGSRVQLITPPYEVCRNLRSAEHCRVTSLEYLLAEPPTIPRSYVKLRLERLWEDGEKASRTNPWFDLYYFPIDAPDFLVLSAWYKQQVGNAWAPGQRVIVPFMEEQGEEEDWAVTASNYRGEVVDVAEAARPSKFFGGVSNTNDVVNSITVKWDTPEDEDSQTSPWELIPDQPSRNRSDDDLVDHAAMAQQFALDNDKQKRLSMAIAALVRSNALPSYLYIHAWRLISLSLSLSLSL